MYILRGHAALGANLARACLAAVRPPPMYPPVAAVRIPLSMTTSDPFPAVWHQVLSVQKKVRRGL